MRFIVIPRLVVIICGFLFTNSLPISAQCTTPITTYPYTEGFETSDGGYVTGGNASDWAWGTPAKPVITGAANGNKCWITGGLTGSAYNNGEASMLISPCFDLTGLVDPQISFSIFWETEKRFDGANIQYSINGGATWQLLGSANDNSCTASNWYNNNSVTYLGNNNGWSGNVQPTVGSCQGGSGSGGWLTARHDLGFIAGQRVIFRFLFGAGTTCNAYDGFAIDDITISETPANSGAFSSGCTGNRNVSFTSTTTGCPTGYSWDFGDIASGAANNSTQANPAHTFSAAGPYTIILTISFPTGPPIMVLQNLNILDVSISPLIPVNCNGDKTAAIAAFVTGGSGVYNYSWNTTPPQTTFDLMNIGAGTYTVSVNSLNACSTSATYIVTEPAAINPVITPAAATCGNNNGSIGSIVSGGIAPYSYAWSNGGTGTSISNLSPGNYSLKITDANGCQFIKNNIPVNNLNIPVHVSLGNDTSVCKGETVTLYPGVFSTYLWQDNSTNPIFTVSSTGKYWVKVSNGSGCIGIDTVNVTVDCSGLYFAGAFTPNGDIWNNDFGAQGNLAAVKNYSFRVYDRYGQLVFYTTNPYTKWDGTNKGGKYNSGTFAWYATYNISGQPPKTQKGTVILLR